MKKTVLSLLCAALVLSMITGFISGAPVTLTEDDVTVTGITSQYFTGVPVTPTPTVKYNGTVLTEGKDYTLSYSNNIVAGSTARIYISFINDYSGEVVKTFFIVPQSSAASVVTGGYDSTISAERGRHGNM